jgi:hypothetical protein
MAPTSSVTAVTQWPQFIPVTWKVCWNVDIWFLLGCGGVVVRVVFAGPASAVGLPGRAGKIARSASVPTTTTRAPRHQGPGGRHDVVVPAPLAWWLG